jgi:hypothetical protein
MFIQILPLAGEDHPEPPLGLKLTFHSWSNVGFLVDSAYYTAIGIFLGLRGLGGGLLVSGESAQVLLHPPQIMKEQRISVEEIVQVEYPGIRGILPHHILRVERPSDYGPLSPMTDEKVTALTVGDVYDNLISAMNGLRESGINKFTDSPQSHLLLDSKTSIFVLPDVDAVAALMTASDLIGFDRSYFLKGLSDYTTAVVEETKNWEGEPKKLVELMMKSMVDLWMERGVTANHTGDFNRFIIPPEAQVSAFMFEAYGQLAEVLEDALKNVEIEAKLMLKKEGIDPDYNLDQFYDKCFDLLYILEVEVEKRGKEADLQEVKEVYQRLMSEGYVAYSKLRHYGVIIAPTRFSEKEIQEFELPDYGKVKEHHLMQILKRLKIARSLKILKEESSRMREMERLAKIVKEENRGKIPQHPVKIAPVDKVEEKWRGFPMSGPVCFPPTESKKLASYYLRRIRGPLRRKSNYFPFEPPKGFPIQPVAVKITVVEEVYVGAIGIPDW